ncbi:FACT complex subunit spt16 [Symbiodinium microadriaticum]|uniref:FACT complex subunit n=1 Tax=Symbiodinium microadriaticum TaxID=2951 RepID=A0A1Q9DGT8_SYMMI|nr:FACT complex subunit spt16 [Symbiodinium microadriaticum]
MDAEAEVPTIEGSPDLWEECAQKPRQKKLQENVPLCIEKTCAIVADPGPRGAVPRGALVIALCPLRVGTFILGVVVKHREYHAALTRTYIVNPTELVKKDYIFVQEVLRIATAALTAGTRCKDVYKAAHDFLTSQRPDLGERQQDYIFVQEVLRIATAALTAGTRCKDVYKAAHDFLTSQRPDLGERFGEDIGFLTGLCLLDPCLQ